MYVHNLKTRTTFIELIDLIVVLYMASGSKADTLKGFFSQCPEEETIACIAVLPPYHSTGVSKLLLNFG
jgi:hypothetical protein